MSAASLTPAQRAARMRRLREHGWTYQRIADRYGITRQRAHVIVNRRQA